MAKGIPKRSLRETIQIYERSYSRQNIFSRNNKVVIFGKAETDLEWHHSVRDEHFFSVTLEVERSTCIDHIPVLISSTLVKKNRLSHSLAGTWLEVAGQLRTYNMIIDGSRQLPMFVFAKAISVFSKTAQIKRRIGTNAIFLDGYVAEYPILYFTSAEKNMSELILTVPARYGKSYLIPCILHGEYALCATTLKYNDFMSLYGHIQNKAHSAHNYPGLILSDYNTDYEVAVMDVLSSTMFRRCNM